MPIVLSQLVSVWSDILLTVLKGWMSVLESFMADQTVLALISATPIPSIPLWTINTNGSDTPDVHRWTHMYSTPTLPLSYATFLCTFFKNNLSYGFSLLLSVSCFLLIVQQETKTAATGEAMKNNRSVLHSVIHKCALHFISPPQKTKLSVLLCF